MFDYYPSAITLTFMFVFVLWFDECALVLQSNLKVSVNLFYLQTAASSLLWTYSCLRVWNIELDRISFVLTQLKFKVRKTNLKLLR
ncbi:CLUMA_CG010675, isoform A [Clunio marinus]|uniref:CLUMA_CG010675, isoform A n=1 Tax=Clunio marinus TaxID=568069 RepID=A0A1J1IAJ5_9DIPT|nr:CLUMA_CG010675, isoform A [Clunio marinus]